MNTRRRLLLGFLLFVLMLTYWGLTGYLQFWFHGSYDGWTSLAKNGHFTLTKVDPQGPANVLQVGDEILAINGQSPDSDWRKVLNLSRAVWPGTTYRMAVKRGDLHIEFLLSTTDWPASLREEFTLFEFLNWLIPALFLFAGYGLLLLKPESKQVWILSLMLMAFGGMHFESALPYYVFAGIGDYIAAAARILSLLLLSLFLHFFLIFPERSRWLERFPRFEYGLYLPMLVIEFFFAPERMQFPWMDHFYRLVHFRWLYDHSLQWIALFLVFAYLIAGLICLGVGYRTANADARRRLRVITAGAGLAFLNLLLLVLIESTGLRQSQKWLYGLVQGATLFTLPLIPLSFAYAIIRHKVIPISLIIRRGVRYLLVSRGSILLLIASVAIFTWLMMDALFRYFRVSDGRVVGTLSAFVALVSWQFVHGVHRRVIAPAIDRRFFRQAYDSQKLMSELADSLQTTTEVPRLLELVATKLQAALQTESVTILLKDQQSGEFKSAYACEYHPRDGQAVNCLRPSQLPANSHALTELSLSDEPLELDWPIEKDAKPVWAGNGRTSNSFLGQELQVLQTLRPALLLPLKVKDELSGAVFLGARLGDLPFSTEDKRLIQSVVAPTSLALQNASLIEQRIEDARRREELEAENEARARELEEARQLQLSMLPKSVPQLPHLEIAAYMKTATEVGGDYYDFHLSSDGTLTVAIGDATGHGLKAGTVVTAMKSLFYTHAAESSLTDTLNQSSRVLKSMNLRSLFMALTLVKLEGNDLRIASAGMPPALLYRRATNEVEEILMKTMPLGSMKNYPYREQSIVLASGDALVLMSDGFPERFNAAGEILGFDKGAGILHLAHSLTATQIVAQFIQAEDQWAQGFAQNDDVTFVVLKVK